MPPSSKFDVLIVTGGLLAAKDETLVALAKKQLMQGRATRHGWLELKIKAVAAEFLAYGHWHRRRASPAVRAHFARRDNLEVPDLTEVTLATLLTREGLTFTMTTYHELVAKPRIRRRLLAAARVVFASTTLLRDLSELEPLARLMKTRENKLVVGGALAGILPSDWEGLAEIDLLAVGYGERLVPVLARWLRSDFRELEAPEGGRLVKTPEGAMRRLHAGAPRSRSLDDLPRPDWALAERLHGKRFRMIYYESVRGCPYRCSFCNYPYLFDDQVFRTKSAQKIADDWEHYRKELGATHLTCLDSLFTAPKPRLLELCRELIERKVGLEWICYARAEHLTDPSTVRLMRDAGCTQVHVGLESGSQRMLDAMNKRTKVEDNARALELCRAAGITTIATLIVGHPGETAATVEETYAFLRKTPPDFFFLATYSTRALGVPILSAESRARFDLETMDNRYTVSPYWRHATMSCADAGEFARQLHRRLVVEGVSLDAALFYAGLLDFKAEQRDELLTFQRDAVRKAPRLMRFAFMLLHRFIDQRLARDVERALPQRIPHALHA